MQDNDILDETLVPNSNNDFWEPIRWWEKKRLLYNLLIVLTILVNLIPNYSHLKDEDGFLLLVVSILVMLLANAFYTLGWSFELFIKYHFKSFNFPKAIRTILLTLGLMGTVYIFWWITMDIIHVRF